MTKINGYTQEEAETLVNYIHEGREEGKTLSYLFDSYGKSHGRAKGSVRNYYYNLLKSRGDQRVERLLAGKDLHAERIREFTEEETEEVIKKILIERSKGLSVRRAIRNIAGENEKMMLRLQNKYRNILKKEPERIQRAGESMGITFPFARDEQRNRSLKKRIEREIDSVYKQINHSLKEENERLLLENSALKEKLQNLSKESV